MRLIIPFTNWFDKDLRFYLLGWQSFVEKMAHYSKFDIQHEVGNNSVISFLILLTFAVEFVAMKSTRRMNNKMVHLNSPCADVAIT